MKPLVCKAPQVRAFLDGATQFRIPMVPQPVIRNAQDGTRYLFHKGKPVFDDQPIETAPYQPGDVLYVKEMWARDDYFYSPESGRLLYKATEDIDPDYPVKWRSPVTMPREYARILLLVKDVRVERLKDIRPEEIKLLGFRLDYDKAPVMGERLFSYFYYWNILYPKYPYDSNPYTYVYDVERIEK